MYKFLLCLRYLRTRYIALICIVSVTLGVATMIVVNSVMAGFTHEMQTHMRGATGDIVFRARSLDGVPDAEEHIAKIRDLLGSSIAGISPLVEVPALMYFETSGGTQTRQIMLVGIDKASYLGVSNFGEYLQHPANRQQLSFELRDGGYDVYDHQVEDPTKLKPRIQMQRAGWAYRRSVARAKQRRQIYEANLLKQNKVESPSRTLDPFAAQAAANEEVGERDFNAFTEQHTGIVLGLGICSYRNLDGSEAFQALPGSDVRVSFPTATLPAQISNGFYTITDFYESKMGELDASYAFVPLRQLQASRGMIDPTTGVGNFTSIRIKLKPAFDASVARDLLRNEFPSGMYAISTWKDQQHPILQAVQVETLVLNVLLFMIVAVAGFGILAIFYMIVVEKTRDIGILKSLGASSHGVMGIFLGYGLCLGVVGSGVGLTLGLLFQKNINAIAHFLSRITGQDFFDPSVYFLPEIPTRVDPITVTWICLGAILIAVLASVMPALRAARLDPVRALRYE